jgi:hypothetical protein
MKRRYALIAVAATAALASTASLIAGLRHALRREHADNTLSDLQQIREELGARVGRIDPKDFPEYLRPRPDLPDADTLRRSLPYNDRPAWHDIREDRDARG